MTYVRPVKPLAPHEGYALAEELKERLVAKNVPVSAMYFYGSVARGNAHRDSDIDVVVVVDPFKEHPWEEKQMVWHEGAEVDIRIEALCMRPEQFESPWSSLAREVKHYGILVR